MVSIRRLYIYLVCAVSLLALTFAVIALLQGLLPPGPSPAVTEIAFQIAVIVIGLPFFLVHWLWAQRLARREPDERASLVRGLYLFGMLATFLSAFVANAFALLVALLQIAFRVQPERFTFGRPSPTPLEDMINAALAMVILLLLWLYHELTVRADVKAAPEGDGWSGVRRVYSYGFSAIGLTLTAIAASQILRWILYQIGGAIPEGASESVLQSLVNELARLAVGVPLWLVFWIWAQRRFKGPNEDERASVVRKLYLYGVVLVAALGAVSAATIILAALLRNALGLTPGGDLRDALSIVIALAAVWAYHTLVLRQDVAVIAEEPRQATIRRLYLYLVAAIGLAALLIGLSGVVSVLIRAVSGEYFGGSLKEPLAWFTAALVAGLPVWLAPWWRAQSAALAPAPTGTEERRSFIRKLYLYGYLFAATMTVLASAIYILFRVLSLILGERTTGNLTADLGQPLAYTLIAMGMWLYHGAGLRHDGQMLQREKAARRADYRVVIVDADQGQLGRAVLSTLQRELPGLSLIPIGLTPPAREAMGATASDKPLAAQLGDATLIVGPWTMEVAGSAGGAVTAEVTDAIQTSPARKLLVPTRGEGWDWVGVDKWDATTLANQTVRAVKQLVEGEELKPARPLNAAVILLLALVGLGVLLPIISILANLLFSLTR